MIVHVFNSITPYPWQIENMADTDAQAFIAAGKGEQVIEVRGHSIQDGGNAALLATAADITLAQAVAAGTQSWPL